MTPRGWSRWWFVVGLGVPTDPQHIHHLDNCVDFFRESVEPIEWHDCYTNSYEENIWRTLVFTVEKCLVSVSVTFAVLFPDSPK